MDPETWKDLRKLLDKVIEVFCVVSETKSYEEAIAVLRTQFRDKDTSPAAWIHAIARKAHPMKDPDTVNPEQFYEILGLIDTREKLYSVVASFPEDDAPRIKTFLEFLLKDYFPSQRSSAQKLAKDLPYRRGGGPESTMPNEEECYKICDFISDLHKEGVLLGSAQKRASKKWKKSVRMIQRIWTDRRQKRALQNGKMRLK